MAMASCADSVGDDEAGCAASSDFRTRRWGRKKSAKGKSSKGDSKGKSAGKSDEGKSGKGKSGAGRSECKSGESKTGEGKSSQGTSGQGKGNSGKDKGGKSGSGSVLGFYGDHPSKPFHQFSNFYYHKRPYEFRLPEFAVRDGWPSVVECKFSEKAIMVVKAALMGDRESFDRMLSAETPGVVKQMGRGVTSFDDALWTRHLEETAYEVVRQKFAADRELASLLLSTGDSTIAEATRNDRIWGIGIDVGDPRVQKPWQWLGKNVLGTALMRTRDFLRGIEEVPAS